MAEVQEGDVYLGSRWRQCAELRSLHRVEHLLRGRLLSIEADALAVMHVYAALRVKMPIFANARAGCWYVPRPAGVAAFKSSDGHYGTWALSLRRPNLHVLHAALVHSGLVLVDATRSGKRYPDALSKTVPIWCAVLTLLGRAETHAIDAIDIDSVLHLPAWVSASEKASIAALIPRWVSEWRAADVELPSELTGRKLRALWVSTAQDRLLWEDGLPSVEELGFIPIVCISASAPSQGRKEVPGRIEEYTFDGIRYPTRTLSYPHVQGAGDDEENWACGLKPDLFWRNHERILEADDGGDGVAIFVENVVQDERTVYSSDNAIFSLGRVEIALMNEAKAHKFANAQASRYTSVLVFGAQCSPDVEMENAPQNIIYYPLRTHKGKSDIKHALCRALGPVLHTLRATKRCLLLGAGANGADAATGSALAWVAWACDSPFAMLPRPRLRAQVTKQRVRASMLALLSLHPQLSLSRAALLQVNRFFQSPNPPCDIDAVEFSVTASEDSDTANCNVNL